MGGIHFGASFRVSGPWVFVLAAFGALLPGSGLYADTIIDPFSAYTNSTGTGGQGSFNTSYGSTNSTDPGYDDNEVFWQFTVGALSNLNAYTLSYATGGFAPDLTLFADNGYPGNTTGVFVAQGAEGTWTGSACSGGQTRDTVATDTASTPTGYCNDSVLQTTLAAGNYLLVLTQDPNISYGDGYTLGDGFLYPGPGTNFNPGYLLEDNTFQRTAAFDVAVSLESVVPEPGTIFLLFSALIAGAVIGRRSLFTRFTLPRRN